jgi:branched-chain amino acid transport system permease protein
MALPPLLRRPRALLGVVALAMLWPAAPVGAQDAPVTTEPATDEPAEEAGTEEESCDFTRSDAEEAYGDSFGPVVWGQLCQVIDGTAVYGEGAELAASQDGAEVASATVDGDGVFLLDVGEPGSYAVSLDLETLPEGLGLTDEDQATLSQVNVTSNGQRAIFRLGEDTRGQRTFDDYATTMAKGLRLGLVLAVAAVGLSLVFGVTGLVNFSHAELVTAGAVAAYLLDAAGLPFWFAVPIALLVGAGVGYGNDRLLWRPLRVRRMALLSMLVVSIGLSIAARNLIQVGFGTAGRRFSASSGQVERAYGPFRLTPNDLLIMAVCVVVLLATTVLLRRTRLGTAIRAVADNADLAASSGIAVDRIIAVVWMLCGALAALGGILYGLTLTVRFDMGFVLLLSMFAAVVLGGLGNAYGAALGAIVIGVVQETSGLFVDTAYKFVVALAVLVIVLLVRPQGILGARERLG